MKWVQGVIIAMEEPMDQLTQEERELWESLKKYQDTTVGEYGLVSVEGLSYLNYATDLLIMGSMYNSGKNWARDDMWRFYELSSKYYPKEKTNGIFFDIGANIGTTSIYFKKVIDRNIQIIAFEPSDKNYKMLDINMRLNDIAESDYCLEKLALADEEGLCAFSYDESNSGGSQLVLGEETNGTAMVKTISLDQYVERSNIDVSKIKYFWVDVEGAEPLFLRGAEQTIRNAEAPMVMEFSPAKYKANGEYMNCVDSLCHLYDSFIYMHDNNNSIHPIDELYRYEDAVQQVDLFLFRVN